MLLFGVPESLVVLKPPPLMLPRCTVVDVISLHKENSAKLLNRNSDVAGGEQKNIDSSESEWLQQLTEMDLLSLP